MTNLNMIFHVVVSVWKLVKIWNSPQFPDEFQNGQSTIYVFKICLQVIWIKFYVLLFEGNVKF